MQNLHKECDHRELQFSGKEDWFELAQKMADRDDKYEEAIKYYTQEMRNNPKNFQAFNNRSLIFARLGYFDKALKDAETAL